MKQIVFLIGAFLMLFQIHSTVTAVPIDTSTGESVSKSFSEVEKTESASNDVEGDKKVIGDAGVVYDKPRSQWDGIIEILVYLTDMVDIQVKIYKAEIANAWRSRKVELTANWEIRANEIEDRVQEIKKEEVAFIGKLEDQKPIAWADVEEDMDEILLNLIDGLNRSKDVVVEKASGTEEERAEIVYKEFQGILEAINELWTKAQKIIIDKTTKASN